MNRPDFSEYVAHFTRDGEPFGKKQNPDDPALKAVKGTAKDKLLSILGSGRIYATPMPWTNLRAVAFTECPWWSLIDHAGRYSPYGLGFTKSHLFAANGGPAIYLRPDLYEKQAEFVHKDNSAWKGFHAAVYAFATPFAPSYAPAHVKAKLPGGEPVDFSHEREWRVPHDFTFQLDQVQFVIVRDYDDVAKFPPEFKDAIGREKFIMMDVYKQIERLWPTHLLGD